MVDEREGSGEIGARYTARHVSGEGDLDPVTMFPRRTPAEVTEHRAQNEPRVARRRNRQPGQRASGQREDEPTGELKARPQPRVLAPHVRRVLDVEDDVDEGPAVVVTWFRVGDVGDVELP